MSNSFATTWTLAYQAPLCPWDFPGKNTGVGCHFLLHWTCLGCHILVHMDICTVTFYFSFSVGIPQLIQLLKSDSEEVKEAAALALANLTTSNPANVKWVQKDSFNTTRRIFNRQRWAHCNLLRLKAVYMSFQILPCWVIPEEPLWK